MLPQSLRPLRLSRRSEPFDSDEYIFELKIDGFRALAHIENAGNLSSYHKPLASLESEENNFRQTSPGISKGGSCMCDYSLHGIRNRLADEGEVLVVHRFFTGSKGLTSPEYLKSTAQAKGWIAALKKFLAAETQACAVCVPDGARLIIYGIPLSLQTAHGLSSAEAVTFRQLSLDVHTYRDAMEFQNGVMVRLQELDEGQRVEVLTLSSEKVGIGEGRFISADA